MTVTVENYAKIINEIYGKSYVILPAQPERECNYPYPIWEYKSAPISIADQYRIGIPISVKLARDFHKTQIDIVHSHCPFTSGLLAQKLLKQSNISLHKKRMSVYSDMFAVRNAGDRQARRNKRL